MATKTNKHLNPCTIYWFTQRGNYKSRYFTDVYEGAEWVLKRTGEADFQFDRMAGEMWWVTGLDYIKELVYGCRVYYHTERNKFHKDFPNKEMASEWIIKRTRDTRFTFDRMKGRGWQENDMNTIAGWANK